MTAQWRGTVPTSVRVGSLSETPEDNRTEFQPDVGPAIRRRRSAVPTTTFTFQAVMSSGQLNELVAMYRTDLADGTLSVERPHPRTGETITMRFVEAPTIAPLGSSASFVVNLSMREMP